MRASLFVRPSLGFAPVLGSAPAPHLAPVLAPLLAMVFTFGLGLAACSGAGNSGISQDPNGSSGSSGASGSSGSSGSSGGPNDGGDGDGSTKPAEETKAGTIALVSNKYTVGATPVELGSATGTFYRIPPATGASANPCVVTTQGVCAVTTCPLGGTPAADAGPSVTYTNSGTVTISGVLVNAGSMTMVPGAYGYTPVSGNAALFAGGENVRVRAPGNPAGAPAFDVSLTAPTGVQVTAPVFNTQGQVTAASSQDLGVAWTGGSSAEVVVQLAAGTQAKSASALCAFAAATGHGTVPSSVLKAVQAVGGAGTSFVVSSSARRVSTIDGWLISVSLSSYGLKPGGLATGTLVIQ